MGSRQAASNLPVVCGSYSSNTSGALFISALPVVCIPSAQVQLTAQARPSWRFPRVVNVNSLVQIVARSHFTASLDLP